MTWVGWGLTADSFQCAILDVAKLVTDVFHCF